MNSRAVAQAIPREWPTLVVLAGCYGAFITLLSGIDILGICLTVPCLAVVLALHSSLQHEVLHGHPFRRQWLNECLIIPALGIFIPYLRFKETHLDHHHDERLTDPYDDPESNYLDPSVWNRLSALKKAAYRFNNTLLGRMLIGPSISLLTFYRQDFKSIVCRDRSITIAYVLHAIGLAIPLYIWYRHSGLPFWAYVLSAYLALSLLKVRTFLEHRAHLDVAGRTVTIEDRGFFAFLFLNNNFHSVHHTHPRMPWFALPAYYRRHRKYVDTRNDRYTYRSYVDVFRQYFWRTKDPVPHPLIKQQAPHCQEKSPPS